VSNSTSLLSKTIRLKFPVMSIVLLKNDENIAVGDLSPIISIWNIKTRKAARHHQVKQLIGHVSQVRTLIHVQDELLASGSNDRTIKTWNYTDGRLLRNLTGHTRAVTQLALMMLSNKNLISCSQDEILKFGI
jgi:WD40 repeat protein